MDRLRIERRGGFTGLPARGEVDLETLAAADRTAIESLFRRKEPFQASPGADRFRFQVTRTNDAGVRTIIVPEHLLPTAIANAIKEELPP